MRRGRDGACPSVARSADGATSRGLTLAAVAERSGLNVGYLSQIENDKASPSLDALAELAAALDVPPAWFLMDEVPAPMRRARRRPAAGRDRRWAASSTSTGGRRATSRSSRSPAGQAVRSARTPIRATSTTSSCAGGCGCARASTRVELGPGDYLRWDGSIPHDGEVMGDEPASMLIIRIDRATDDDPARTIAG